MPKQTDAMKPTSILFIYGLYLLVSCAGPAPKTETKPTNPAPQWVTYKGQEGPGKGQHIVLISGDEEYRSEEALPQLGKILATHHGFSCTILFAQDPAKPGIINPKYLNNIPGMEALASADLMIVFIRFRDLPDNQMQYFEDYLMSGKAVIGMRTATHAFNIKDSTNKWAHYGNYYKGENGIAEWDGGFGRLVLGEKWISHHGHHKHQSTYGVIVEGAADHPITRGLKNGDVWGPTDVYSVRLPLRGDAQPIILGQVMNRAGEYDENDPLFGMKASDSEVASLNPARKNSSYNPNDPMMPVAWTQTYQLPGGESGKSFTSTMGSSTDLLSEGTRRMFVNAVYWLLDKEVPASTEVGIVGDYKVTAYGFMSDEYWEEKNMKVADFLP